MCWIITKTIIENRYLGSLCIDNTEEDMWFENYFSEETMIYLIPIMIFIAKIIEVSVDTIRLIFVSRNDKLIAPILGFVSVSIWITVLSFVVQNLSNIYSYLSYGLGFAMGTYVGILLEEKLVTGFIIFKVFLVQSQVELKEALIKEGYGFTTIDAQGASGKVNLFDIIVKRKDIQKVVNLIKDINPNAFYTIETAKTAKLGIFPTKKSHPSYFRRSVLGNVKGK
jgi:uncharacterized protein YebE (UPF0316 family)